MDESVVDVAEQVVDVAVKAYLQTNDCEAKEVDRTYDLCRLLCNEIFRPTLLGANSYLSLFDSRRLLDRFWRVV